jgi:hypothetical protein
MCSIIGPKAITRVAVLVSAIILFIDASAAEPVTVRYTEGVMHGFLELQTLAGKNIAWGEVTQFTEGDRVTSRIMFSFRDRSFYEETTTFSQRGTFRLIRDHLVQKGPAFKQSMDTTVDATTGQVTVRYTDKDGKEKTESEKLDLPNDVANGLTLILLKDVAPNGPGTEVSMVAATPKPRLVTLEITPQGADSFSVGNLRRKATHYVVKPKIGGVAGAVAPLIGKQPPDLHVWVVEGQAPGFIRFEGPLEQNGESWRIQMAPPPVFQQSGLNAASRKRRADRARR